MDDFQTHIRGELADTLVRLIAASVGAGGEIPDVEKPAAFRSEAHINRIASLGIFHPLTYHCGKISQRSLAAPDKESVEQAPLARESFRLGINQRLPTNGEIHSKPGE